MRAETRWLFVIVLLLLSIAAWAEQPEPAWVGLTGLYTQPTAETLPRGVIGLKYSEIRFKQVSDGTKLSNIWFTGGATVVPFSRWEFAVLWRNENVKTGPSNRAGFANAFTKAMFTGDVKYVIIQPGDRKLGVAVGVLDVTGTTRHLDGLDTRRGQRIFLVGSYEWAHLAITDDANGLGLVGGARWGITSDIDLLAEFSFAPMFVEKAPQPLNHYNFNLGLRIFPPQVPRLHFDLTAVGDGEFEFGFALGYNL